MITTKTLNREAPGERLNRKPAPKIPRITYATLAVTAEDDKAYDAALARVRGQLGKHYANFVNGASRGSNAGEFADVSPVDRRVTVSYFPKGTREDARAAIQAARAAFEGWRTKDYHERIAILQSAADLIIERRFDLAAWMAIEVGKNRGEALAEINEAAELIRYSCTAMDAHKGFIQPLESPGERQTTMSVLRPYGVWAVIAPWNFPSSLAAGMSAGALLAGNTVVFKPSSESPLIGYELYRTYVDAGVPDGVFNLIVGPGATVGAELQENPGVDGMSFTGSADVGMRLYKEFATRYPKPVIAEMGGKNPAVISANADLDEAAEGVMRAAFGFGGQKCSACSRVYVDKRVKDKFLQLLVEHTKNIAKVGDPSQKETFVGPVISRAAVETYLQAVEDARKSDGIFHLGGHQLTDGDFEYGNFVEPAIVELPKTHRLFQDELFVPFVAVASVDSFEEGVQEANNSRYGLCAGVYSRDEKEIARFFDQIQAGVTYCNRRAGATTGAWPNINTFGGWKESGTTGKNAHGPYYVQQFMREQSRWIVHE